MLLAAAAAAATVAGEAPVVTVVANAAIDAAAAVAAAVRMGTLGWAGVVGCGTVDAESVDFTELRCTGDALVLDDDAASETTGFAIIGAFVGAGPIPGAGDALPIAEDGAVFPSTAAIVPAAAKVVLFFE